MAVDDAPWDDARYAACSDRITEGHAVGKVVARISMSPDGYTTDPSGKVGPLFDWALRSSG
jgi:hypothetical protein